MFGISFEHILILGVILLVVGPKRLPELGNTMGKALKNFKESLNGLQEANFTKIADKPAAPPASTAAPAVIAPLTTEDKKTTIV